MFWQNDMCVLTPFGFLRTSTSKERPFLKSLGFPSPKNLELPWLLELLKMLRQNTAVE